MQLCDLCGADEAEAYAEKFDLWYVRCVQCGFVYADVRDFDFASFNVKVATTNHDHRVSKRTSSKHLKNYHKLLDEFEPYRQTGRFLEVGCATGSFLSTVCSRGWQGQGVEPVAESARYGIEELGLDVHVGTLGTAGYDSGAFDVVYSNAVLEHVSSPKEVVGQACDVLRPGGLFYADTVNLDSYTWRFLGPRWKLFDPRVHLSLFTPETLGRYCEEAGMNVVKTTTHGVRFNATRADKPTGFKWLLDELRKAPYSWAARKNLKGDNIAVYAVKK